MRGGRSVGPGEKLASETINPGLVKDAQEALKGSR